MDLDFNNLLPIIQIKVEIPEAVYPTKNQVGAKKAVNPFWVDHFFISHILNEDENFMLFIFFNSMFLTKIKQ